jgi:integrase
VPTRQSPSVAGVIEGSSPTSVGPVAAAFARRVVAEARPASVARAKAFLFAAAKLGEFAGSVGLEPTKEMLLDEALIERFILCGTQWHSAGTRRTLRTSLRALGRAVAPNVGPGATALPRERAKAPYSQGEIDAYLALAAAQPTLSRRRRAAGLIALGAGAGLVGADLRAVRGTDVFARSGGLVVVAGGKKSRVVPVLARYHQVLGDAAAFAGTHYVVGGDDPARHNVTTPLISSLSGGIDLGRLDAGRLRASWLMTCAEAIGLSSFMTAAGLTCSQRLGDLVAGAPPLREAEIVALLGGCAE